MKCVIGCEVGPWPVHGISHLVFVLEGSYVIETRGGEERRGVAEQLTAGTYRKKHLQHTPDGERKRNKKGEIYCMSHVVLCYKIFNIIFTCTSPDSPPLNAQGSASTLKSSAPDEAPHPVEQKPHSLKADA